MKLRLLIGVPVAAAALTLGTATPALAAPSQIDYGILHDNSLGYSAYAEFFSGTGHIRATLGCDSGNEHYTVYGNWVGRNGQSSTAYCASASTSYYQTKNT